MGFPSPSLSLTGSLLDQVSNYLKKRHTNKFLIINLSEKDYDYSKFDNQVGVLWFVLFWFDLICLLIQLKISRYWNTSFQDILLHHLEIFLPFAKALMDGWVLIQPMWLPFIVWFVVVVVVVVDWVFVSNVESWMLNIKFWCLNPLIDWSRKNNDNCWRLSAVVQESLNCGTSYWNFVQSDEWICFAIVVANSAKVLSFSISQCDSNRSSANDCTSWPNLLFYVSRYIGYVANVMENRKPSTHLLKLERVIVCSSFQLEISIECF